MTKSPRLNVRLRAWPLDDLELLYAHAKHEQGLFATPLYADQRWRVMAACRAELCRRGVEAQDHPTLFFDGA